MLNIMWDIGYNIERRSHKYLLREIWCNLVQSFLRRWIVNFNPDMPNLHDRYKSTEREKN